VPVAARLLVTAAGLPVRVTTRLNLLAAGGRLLGPPLRLALRRRWRLLLDRCRCWRAVALSMLGRTLFPVGSGHGDPSHSKCCHSNDRECLCARSNRAPYGRLSSLIHAASLYGLPCHYPHAETVRVTHAGGKLPANTPFLNPATGGGIAGAKAVAS
jgi:hypothetical protein